MERISNSLHFAPICHFFDLSKYHCTPSGQRKCHPAPFSAVCQFVKLKLRQIFKIGNHLFGVGCTKQGGASHQYIATGIHHQFTGF